MNGCERRECVVYGNVLSDQLICLLSLTLVIILNHDDGVVIKIIQYIAIIQSDGRGRHA